MAARVQRSLRQLCASLLWLLLLECLGGELARADDASTVSLELQAGATCLQASLLRDSLDGWLRQSVQHAALTVQVRGSIEDPRSVTIVLLRAGQPLSQRAFRPGPPRCPDFHSAVALGIALMLKNADAPEVTPTLPSEPDPASSASTDEPPPSAPVLPVDSFSGPPERFDAAAAPSEPSVAPVLVPEGSARAPDSASRPDAPAVREVARREIVFSTRASALLATHEASSIAAGAGIELGLGDGVRWSLRAGVLGLFSASQVLEPQAGAQAEGQVRYRSRPLLASLLGCGPLFHGTRARVQGCVGMLAGRVQFHGRQAGGSAAVPASSVAWTALQAQLELALRLGRRGWVFLAVLPTYGLRQLGTTALDSHGVVAAHDRLPRLGALFALGLALDFSAKALAPRGMNER